MNELKLRHYGRGPLILDRERRYKQGVLHKPRGLWVSVLGEDDWPSWCKAENFAMDSLGFEDTITIKDSTNILKIEDGLQLMEFHREFGVETAYVASIDWARVVQKYDGIIIAPYQWSFRLNNEVGWYHGWDCASGCVWNLDVLEVSETKEGSRNDRQGA